MAQETGFGTLFAPNTNRGFGGHLAGAWHTWKRRPLGLIGGVIILLAIVVAAAAPWIAPHGPKDFVGGRLEKPSSEYLLGTNSLGQDVFSRTIYGAQVSIGVGLSSAFVGVAIGTALALLSGYVGGWVDIVVQRLLEVLASFPGLILALMVVSALGRPHDGGTNIINIMWQLRALECAIALALVFGTTRVVGAAVLTERQMPYIEAARSIGCSPLRIVLRHILPNVAPYIIVVFTSLIGLVILAEASLSFLGFGVPSGTPSWGIDLAARNRESFLHAPSLIAGPAIALSLTVLGFNFLGDALRDILDPRLRGAS